MHQLVLDHTAQVTELVEHIHRQITMDKGNSAAHHQYQEVASHINMALEIHIIRAIMVHLISIKMVLALAQVMDPVSVIIHSSMHNQSTIHSQINHSGLMQLSHHSNQPQYQLHKNSITIWIHCNNNILRKYHFCECSSLFKKKKNKMSLVLFFDLIEFSQMKTK